MAATSQPTEGYARVEYKVTLDQKRVLKFDPNTVTFVDAEIKDDVYGVGTGLHTFRALDPEFVESLRQVMANADPILEFRLGFGSDPAFYWLPWQKHVIVTPQARFEGIGTAAGHLITICSANNLVRMERSNKVLARKGLISEIVTAIAQDNKLDAVIEPTNGKFLLYQNFIDDTRFIRQRCLPRAITVNGRGGFYFYIRDNVLHFHTPDYQGNVIDVSYYNVFGTELIANDASQDPTLWDSGVAGVRLIAQNPYTAQSKEFKSQPENALKLADSIYQFSTIVNGESNIPYHLGFNPAVEADAIAQFTYQRARQRTFKTTITLDKTINIRHGDLLNLSITQQSSKASSFSGYYYVTAVSHIVKKQSVTTMYTLERGELSGQLQSFSTQDAQQQLAPVTQAPGQSPNILAMQNSELTLGAGKAASARTYAVVADANTGQPV
jgi:hypothetical protein